MFAWLDKGAGWNVFAQVDDESIFLFYCYEPNKYTRNRYVYVFEFRIELLSNGKGVLDAFHWTLEALFTLTSNEQRTTFLNKSTRAFGKYGFISLYWMKNASHIIPDTIEK